MLRRRVVDSGGSSIDGGTWPSKVGSSSHERPTSDWRSATQAAAPGGPAASTTWQKVQLLLHGFQQPGLEQQFVCYQYQHTLLLDAIAAFNHGLVTLAAIAAFPMYTWRQPEVQLGMLSYVLCCFLPAWLVWSLRQWLGPRGREAATMLGDVTLSLQVRVVVSWT